MADVQVNPRLLSAFVRLKRHRTLAGAFAAYLGMLKIRSQITAKGETGVLSTATDTLLLLLVAALFALLAIFAFHVS
ncbi:hypothetical protein WNZ14_08130 [Hoeflea sp. AS60]|uniref:hypothetical protein n=1 Tax=Hoeflea sp. AS60 TaxID=3135780 RepID=UPI00317ED3C3